MDFHKLSAVMCRCIIGNKPFSFDKAVAEKYLKQSHSKRKSQKSGISILRYQIDNIYVNYKLAFLVGESIAFDDLVQWAQRQIDYVQRNPRNDVDSEKVISIYSRFIERLDNVGTLLDYEWENKQHDPFFESMVNCLIKNDILKRDFNYLLFAANMFQWQEYTKYSLFNEILKSEMNTTISLHDLIRGQDNGVIHSKNNYILNDLWLRSIYSLIIFHFIFVSEIAMFHFLKFFTM